MEEAVYIKHATAATVNCRYISRHRQKEERRDFSTWRDVMQIC